MIAWVVVLPWNVGSLTHVMLKADATKQGLGLCPGVRTWLEYLLWKVASVNGKWLIHHEECFILQGDTLWKERASLRKPDWGGLHWCLPLWHWLDCGPSQSQEASQREGGKKGQSPFYLLWNSENHQRTLLRRWKDNLQNARKYLEITYLARV